MRRQASFLLALCNYYCRTPYRTYPFFIYLPIPRTRVHRSFLALDAPKAACKSMYLLLLSVVVCNSTNNSLLFSTNQLPPSCFPQSTPLFLPFGNQ